MVTIHKYPMPINRMVSIMLPEAARVLTVQVQKGRTCIWAMVDTEMRMVPREFAWYGTGHPISSPRNKEYVGTVQLDGGDLIFHLFEVQ